MPILYNGRPYPPELPLPIGDLDSHLMHDDVGPRERAHNLNGTSIGSAVLAQMTAMCPYTLQWFAYLPFKDAHSHGGNWSDPM